MGLLVLAAVLATAVYVLLRGTRGQRLLVAAVLCAALILAQAGPQSTRRSDGPAWQPQLASASEQCRRDDELRFVNLRETIGWKVTVPCRYLVDEASR